MGSQRKKVDPGQLLLPGKGKRNKGYWQATGGGDVFGPGSGEWLKSKRVWRKVVFPKKGSPKHLRLKLSSPPEPDTLSEQLRSVIVEKGLTAYGFGKLVGLDPGVIQRFMNKERDIRLETADKLAKALGLRLVSSKSHKYGKGETRRRPSLVLLSPENKGYGRGRRRNRPRPAFRSTPPA